MVPKKQKPLNRSFFSLASRTYQWLLTSQPCFQGRAEGWTSYNLWPWSYGHVLGRVKMCKNKVSIEFQPKPIFLRINGYDGYEIRLTHGWPLSEIYIYISPSEQTDKSIPAKARHPLWCASAKFDLAPPTPHIKQTKQTKQTSLITWSIHM